MSIEFFQTQMGKRFYEGTMPSIAKSLEVIAKNLDGVPTKKELRYKELLDSIVEKTAEENTLSEQVRILKGYGFTDEDLKDFGYSEANIAGKEDFSDISMCL